MSTQKTRFRIHRRYAQWHIALLTNYDDKEMQNNVQETGLTTIMVLAAVVIERRQCFANTVHVFPIWYSRFRRY